MAQAQPQKVRAAALLVLLIVPLLLGGCWDSAELNDRGIVSIIGVDRAEGGRYRVWMQILQPVQVGQAGRGPLIPTNLISGEGASMEEAARAVQLNYVPRLYYGHLQMIVFQERLAQAGVREVVEWINQSPDRRLSQLLLVTRVPIPEHLQMTSPLSVRSVNVVRESLGSKIGGSATLGAWSEDRAVAGREPVMGIHAPIKRGGQVVRQDESRFEGIALYRGDRMVSALPAEDSIPFLLLNGDLVAGPSVQAAYVDHEHRRVAVTWYHTKVKRWTEVSGGRVRYRVSFTVRGRLSQAATDLHPYRMEDVREVEAAVAQALAQRMQTVFAKLQAAQVDSIGVGQSLHGSKPGYWRQVRNRWNEQTFPQVQLVVSPNVKIVDEGLSKRHFRTRETEEEAFGSKPPKPKPTR
jgi:spore germination protein KC